MRARKLRADDYLCRLCQSSRASVWDHCHGHDLVRGPVCASCNTFEGKGLPELLLRREEVVAHLLECSRCREERTLPPRFHAAVAGLHLEAEARHASCLVQPAVRHRAPLRAGTSSTCTATGTGPRSGARRCRLPRRTSWCVPSSTRRSRPDNLALVCRARERLPRRTRGRDEVPAGRCARGRRVGLSDRSGTMRAELAGGWPTALMAGGP
ncbi:endonuclease domain-containing protein [Streptomyces hydrogenans]|uniref:endonuclease domain-containing protein n=1 Tax=Streptomyces hydrogenans TaxID=1873719 RepID=UPI001CFC6DC9